MTDHELPDAAITLAAESMRLAKLVENLLPHVLPATQWDTSQETFRISPEDKDNPFLFCWMKLAGAVATVVPMCTLMIIGSYFAAAILARSIFEATLSITFMFPDPKKPQPWPSPKQEKALDQFYTEIWEDFLKPFDTTKKTSQISLDDLCSAWGNFISAHPGLNPHDMIQTARQNMSFYSNHTHMGYPALMELLREQPLRLSGKDTCALFTLQHAAIILDNVCQSTSSLLLFHIKLYREIPNENMKRLVELFEQNQRDVDAISHRLQTGFGLICDEKKLLRAMKTGKSIDNILNPATPEKSAP